MANNNSSISAVPLTAKLNLNRNQQIINPTYDQLNKGNSPIYGGALSPMWRYGYKDEGTLYNSDGVGYTMNKYYRVYEVGRDLSQKRLAFETLDTSFKEIELESAGYMEVAPIQNYSSGGKGELVYVGMRQDGEKTLRIECKSHFYEEGGAERTVLHSYKTATYDGRKILAARMVPKWQVLAGTPSNETPLLLIVITEGQPAKAYRNTSDINMSNYAPYHIYTSLYTVSSDGTISDRQAYNWSGFTLEYQYKLTEVKTATEISGENINGANAGNTPFQIIVSAPFSMIDSTSNETYYSQQWQMYTGITVLNKRQTGELMYGNFSHCNFAIHRRPGTSIIKIVSQMLINPGNTVVSRFLGKEGTNASTVVSTNKIKLTGMVMSDLKTQDSYCRLASGIFVDESTMVYQAGWRRDSQGVSDADDNMDLIQMVGDLAKGENWFCKLGEFNAICMLNSGLGDSNARFSQGYQMWVGDNNDVLMPNDADVAAAAFVTNQRHFRGVFIGRQASKRDYFGEWFSFMTDNAIGARVVSNPGVVSTMTMPDSWSEWNTSSTYWKNKEKLSDTITNNQGSMAPIGNTKWRCLYNYKQGYLSGISYAENPNDIGTLVTQWDSIDDSVFVHGIYQAVVYKNIKTGKFKAVLALGSSYWNNAPHPSTNRLKLINHRYLIVNTSKYVNMLDTKTGKYGHFASDWNNRVIGGVNRVISLGSSTGNDGTGWTNQYYPDILTTTVNVGEYGGSTVNRETTRWLLLYPREFAADNLPQFYTPNASVASSVGGSYLVTNDFAPARMWPYTSYQRYMRNFEQVIAGNVPKSSEVSDLPTVAYYYSGSVGSPYYLTSYKDISASPYNTVWYSTPTTDGIQQGTTFPTSSYYNIPMVGWEFVESFSGKTSIIMNGSGYNLQYNNQDLVMLYSTSSVVANISDFFILQSQYYAVIDGYICAVSYSSNNVITNVEQVVNVSGMRYIGALPSVAYFYSPALKAIYAFTGDADLQLFIQSDKIKEVYASEYSTSKEWIYMATNAGLYVLSQQNVFCLEDLNKVDAIYTTALSYDIIHQDGKSVRIGLDRDDVYSESAEETECECDKVILETEYFGPGNLQQEVLDCWYVKLMRKDDIPDGQTVSMYVKSITDEVRKSPVTTITIGPDDWDEDGVYLYRYQPELQLAQGVSLHIESPYPVLGVFTSHQTDSVVLTPVKQSGMSI